MLSRRTWDRLNDGIQTTASLDAARGPGLEAGSAFILADLSVCGFDEPFEHELQYTSLRCYSMYSTESMTEN